LTLDDKREVYLLLIKELLIRNGCLVDQIRGYDLIGRFKKLHFIVRCLFNQPCYLVFNNEVKEFADCIEKEPKEVIGFLVSNTFFSDEVLRTFGKNGRILFCHENDIIDNIVHVEENNENQLNILLGAFENIINIQKGLLKQLKEMSSGSIESVRLHDVQNSDM
ncbi:19527_t:CDS:2, partial [Cetraspora pellucida]